MRIRRDTIKKSKPEVATPTGRASKKHTKRIGSGRTHGSVSFYRASLKDLNAVLNPDSQVVLGRKFAESLKIPGTPVGAKTTSEELVAA